jgi:hypothetical protein
MPAKTELQSVEFFRKVRDEQASLLAGRSPEEIVAFFAKRTPTAPNKPFQRNRQKAARR